MNAEQINIAIAEACGWEFEFIDPSNKQPTGRQKDSYYNEEFPNYHGSLDAMHEAEKVLTDSEFYAYQGFLRRTTHQQGLEINKQERNLTSAAAPQRAEAFLRTLGKWEAKETKPLAAASQPTDKP